MEKKRSKGVTIFGWYFIITSITGLLFNLRSLFSQQPNNLDTLSKFAKLSAMAPSLARIGSIVALFLSPLVFFIGFNILRLKVAWLKVTIYYSCFSLIYYLIFYLLLFKNPIDAAPGLFSGCILFAIIIFFFSRPKVKEQFK